jgi:hypothetical protein
MPGFNFSVRLEINNESRMLPRPKPIRRGIVQELFFAIVKTIAKNEC